MSKTDAGTAVEPASPTGDVPAEPTPPEERIHKPLVCVDESPQGPASPTPEPTPIGSLRGMARLR